MPRGWGRAVSDREPRAPRSPRSSRRQKNCGTEKLRNPRDRAFGVTVAPTVFNFSVLLICGTRLQAALKFSKWRQGSFNRISMRRLVITAVSPQRCGRIKL